jgi:23S rRNA (adenine2503-C2)-methyltransferase
MKQFCTLTPEKLKSWLEEVNEKPYHKQQILDWVYGKSVIDWSLMSNLSKGLQQKLSEHFSLNALKLIKVTESNDKETVKFLWKLHDDKVVESVLIYSGARRTVCVSSQVGCAVRCAFCASGKKGLFRNLSAAEIVEQVIQINHWLAPHNERVSHIVYMGMGEPLMNYDSVVNSVHLITHPELLNISHRRITISTVGIIEGIKRLSHEDLKVNLVLSLHAPNQHIRHKIIPFARKYSLENIVAAMDEYAQKTKRDITYEYILIAGINDHPDHAFELATLLRGRQCTVNLIPYNPVEGLKLRRPAKKDIKLFRSVLYGCRIVNTCRYTKGDDIAAACGQLAIMNEK